MIRNAWVMCAVVVAAACGSPDYDVDHVRPGAEAQPGIVYALPRTVVTVAIDVRARTDVVGRYAAYAEAAGLPPPSRHSSTRYEIAAVSVSARVVPDPDQRYLLSVDELLEDQALSVALTEAGFLIGQAEAGQDPVASEPSSAVIDRVDEAAADLVPIAQESPAPAWVIAHAERMRAMVERRDRTLAEPQRVVPCAGDDCPEPRSHVAERLDAEVAVLRSAFGVTETVRMETTVLEVVPTRDSELPGACLATLDASSGALSACTGDADATGTVHLALVPAHCQSVAGADAECVQTWLDNRPSDAADGEESGFFYRVPAAVTAIVTVNGRAKARANLLVPQLGYVASLPGVSLTRTLDGAFRLHPATGGVQSIGLTSDGVVEVLAPLVEAAARGGSAAASTVPTP